MSLIERITPKHIQQLVPYASAKRELFNVEVATNSLWLNANESPYDEQDNRYNRYPDFQSDGVIDGYANYAGVPAEQVLVTRGADEGIELLVRTFCEPGIDSIIINPPTYGMYKICASTFNVKTIEVPLTQEYQLNTQALIEQKNKNVKLVFICSPNNPTGEVIARQNIVEVLEAYKQSALVVLDEAYIEFCPEQTVASLLASYPNLVILRTLSKAFALAGIRCGFTLANPSVIEMLKKVIAPYPIPAPVEQQATKVLSDTGVSAMRQQVTKLNQQKATFVEQLNTFDFVERILASDTNFVLFKVNNKTTLLNALKEQDIYIRDQSSQPTLDSHVRVTIGSETQMNKLITVFKGLAK